MPEGNKIWVLADGVESNRPATNFPGISVDSNRVDCLDEMSLGGYKALTSKLDPLCQRVAQWQARFVQDPEVGHHEFRHGKAQVSRIWAFLICRFRGTITPTYLSEIEVQPLALINVPFLPIRQNSHSI